MPESFKKIKNWIGSAIFGLILVLAFLTIFSLSTNQIEVQGATETCGLNNWAWSGYLDNFGKLGGIGWSSFWSGNPNSGGGNYSVEVNQNTGDMTGYVWSSNIGWIKFGGFLPIFPAGGGTVAENAKLNIQTNQVTGWVRACSVFDPGPNGVVNCGGDDVLKSDTFRGGWDGWIALSGSWQNAVSYDPSTKKFDGYGWGGNKVIGWFDFVNVGYSDANCGQSEELQYIAFIDPPPPLVLRRSKPEGENNSRDLKIIVQSDDPQTVEITSIEENIVPEGDNIKVEALQTSCNTGSERKCAIDLRVSYKLKPNGAPIETASFDINTKNADGRSSAVTTFNMRILSTQQEESGIVCSASPNPVFRDQPVTWFATEFGGLNAERYEWYNVFSDDAQEEPFSTTLDPKTEILEGYPDEGVRTIRVIAVDELENGETSYQANCTVQILPEIYFEQI